VDVPNEDDTATFTDYADAAIEQIGPDVEDLVVVAHSLGGFTGPIVASRLPTRLLVLVAAMIPERGESAGDWWTNTGHSELGVAVDDPETTFLHDVPPALGAEAGIHMRVQSGKVFEDPWPLEAWPDVPTRVLLCTGDRFFPADFQRQVTQDRLGTTPDELDCGHLPMLAKPHELVDRLVGYLD
jgi:pimeloyl-ACP methyl ester carboxylesterase